MNRKYSIIILAILFLASVSMIYVVQAKRQPKPTSEKFSEYLDLGPTDTSLTSRYEPSNPKVVTVWIFPPHDPDPPNNPDKHIENGETFRVNIYYGDYSESAKPQSNAFYNFPISNDDIYNQYPRLAFNRQAIAYPIEIEIRRQGTVGNDIETFEVQWIIEEP